MKEQGIVKPTSVKILAAMTEDEKTISIPQWNKLKEEFIGKRLLED